MKVPVVCAARGDMRALVYGTYATTNKPGGWDAREVLELLGFTVDTVAITEAVPDLCPYSLLWMAGFHVHGEFSDAELAAIQAFVEDQGGSLLLMGDTDAEFTLTPINQVAGIWGCDYTSVVATYAISPSTGQASHDLWVTPTKGVGLQSAYRLDSKINTIGTGFTQFADGTYKVGIYREFNNGGRVVMSLLDAIIDHDGWLVNILGWLDGVEAEAFSDDFADLAAWTLTEQTMHDVSIVDGTWVRFEPIASGGAAWSPYSSIVHTLASPITGDFLLAFNFRYYQPNNTPISEMRVQLLNADNNVVAEWALLDEWTANTGALGYQYCDTAGNTAEGTMPASGHFRMSIFRSGGTVYLCSGVLQGGAAGSAGAPYYMYGSCTRTVAKVKIQYRHYSGYWTATEYYDVDKVSLWS